MKNPITDFLRYLRIPVSTAYCEQLIASHPNHPSLLSIVDTLDRLGIPNIAAKVEKSQLSELVFPYVLHLATRHGDFIAVRSERDLTKNKEKLEDWDGVVLHIAPTNTITDPENAKYYKRERFYSFLTSLSAAALLIPFAWFAATNLSLVTTGTGILGIGGLVVGYLLVAKDIGIKFDVVESFCTPVGKRNDCERVLESEGASFFGSVKLSDMVFIYFLCQVCWMAVLAVVPAWTTPVTQTLSVIGVATIPMVVYSVIYQFRIKTWCKLCLIVDGVLLVQAVLFATMFVDQSEWIWSPTVSAAMAASAFLVGSLVILFKGSVEESLEFRKAAASASRVKNASGVFTYLALQQKREVTYNSPHHFVSGRPDTPVRLVMVSNLFCKPCADQHKVVEKLVDTFPEHISVEFRFIRARERDVTPNSNQYIIEYWMRNIKGRGNETELINKLMTDWYELMDFPKFRIKYPMENDTPSVECVAMEKEHVEWTDRQEIQQTPTTFINGLLLPKQYLPADLAPVIQSLAAEFKAKAKANVVKEGVKDLV